MRGFVLGLAVGASAVGLLCRSPRVDGAPPTLRDALKGGKLEMVGLSLHRHEFGRKAVVHGSATLVATGEAVLPAQLRGVCAQVRAAVADLMQDDLMQFHVDVHPAAPVRHLTPTTLGGFRQIPWKSAREAGDWDRVAGTDLVNPFDLEQAVPWYWRVLWARPLQLAVIDDQVVPTHLRNWVDAEWESPMNLLSQGSRPARGAPPRRVR